MPTKPQLLIENVFPQLQVEPLRGLLQHLSGHTMMVHQKGAPYTHTTQPIAWQTVSNKPKQVEGQKG